MAEADARGIRLEAVESEDDSILALGQAEDMAAIMAGSMVSAARQRAMKLAG